MRKRVLRGSGGSSSVPGSAAAEQPQRRARLRVAQDQKQRRPLRPFSRTYAQEPVHSIHKELLQKAAILSSR